MPRSREIHSCFVCTFTTCGKWGGDELLESLKERLVDSPVRVKAYMCFGACATGPNVILDPQGTWYADVRPEDADEIAAHILGGDPVERLLYEADRDTMRMALWMTDEDLE
jgi:NADP-reducing hydrogenase subunit HndC